MGKSGKIKRLTPKIKPTQAVKPANFLPPKKIAKKRDI